MDLFPYRLFSVQKVDREIQIPRKGHPQGVGDLEIGGGGADRTVQAYRFDNAEKKREQPDKGKEIDAEAEKEEGKEEEKEEEKPPMEEE